MRNPMLSYLELLTSIVTNKRWIKLYVNICKKANDRSETRKEAISLLGYIESHHIVPKCFGLGGEKDIDNLVFLTAREHYICHKILSKMFSGTKKNQMIYAFLGMRRTNGHQGKRSEISSKEYEIAKKNLDKTKYMYKGVLSKKVSIKDTEHQTKLINEGWTFNIPDSIRLQDGRFGNNKNLHSEETKKLMIESSRKRLGKYPDIKLYLLDQLTIVEKNSEEYKKLLSEGWNPKITFEFRSVQTSRINKERYGKDTSKKQWFHHPITKVNKLVIVGELEPEGWVKGLHKTPRK